MSIFGAVSIVTIENNRLLILKRAINPLDPWSGQLSLPGGKIDPEDSHPLAAARRETWEECKIELPILPNQELPHEVAFVKESEYLTIAPFHFDLEYEPVIALETKEHSEFFWVSIAELKDKQNHQLAYLSSSFPDKLMPYININGTPLWGFTYKVLSNFLKW